MVRKLLKQQIAITRNLSIPQLALIILLLPSCGTDSSTGTEVEEAPLNFVLIYTDELQFSDIGAYGGQDLLRVTRRGL